MALRMCTIRCRGDAGRMTDCVSAFLQERGYSVADHKGEAGSSARRLIAEVNIVPLRELVKSPRPARVDAVITNEPEGVRINLGLTPSLALRSLFHGMVLCSLGLTVLVMCAVSAKMACGDRAGAIRAIWGFLGAWCLMVLSFMKGKRVLGINNFAARLAGRIELWSGYPVKVYGGHLDHPDIMFSITTTVIIIMATLLFTADSIGVYTLIPFAVIGLLLGFLHKLSKKDECLGRIFFGYAGLQIGSLVAAYSTTPYWLSLILKSVIMGPLVQHLPQCWINILSIARTSGGGMASNLMTKEALSVAIFGYATVFIGLAIMALRLFRFAPNEFIKDVDRLRNRMVHFNEYYSAGTRLSTIFQFTIWVIIVPLNAFGVYAVLSSCEVVFVGHNVIFPNSFAMALYQNTLVIIGAIWNSHVSVHAAEIILRVCLLLYVMPVVCLVSIVLAKVTRTLVKGARESFFPTLATMPTHVRMLIKNIAEYAKVKTPRITMTRATELGARIRIPFWAFRRAQIGLTTGSVESLDEMEMGCLLAHELGHLKQRRSRYYGVLTLISRLTLLGNSWLLVGVDFIQGEYEADAFALSWVERYAGRDRGRKAMQSLFKKLMRQEMANAMTSLAGEQNSEQLMAAAPWLPERLRSRLLAYNNTTLFNRAITALGVYYQVYIGDTILLYMHPTLTQRLVMIESENKVS